jgi:hypothetical protein
MMPHWLLLRHKNVPNFRYIFNLTRHHSLYRFGLVIVELLIFNHQARFDSDPAAVLAELREQKHQISEKRARRQHDAKAAGERGSCMLLTFALYFDTIFLFSIFCCYDSCISQAYAYCGQSGGI